MLICSCLDFARSTISSIRNTLLGDAVSLISLAVNCYFVTSYCDDYDEDRTSRYCRPFGQQFQPLSVEIRVACESFVFCRYGIYVVPGTISCSSDISL